MDEIFYTQYPIMTKWKYVFGHFCKYIENKIQKYLIFISIDTLKSIHVSKSLWIRASAKWLKCKCNHLWRRLQLCVFLGKLCTPGLYNMCTLFYFTILQALSSWLLIISEQPFSSLARFSRRFKKKLLLCHSGIFNVILVSNSSVYLALCLG
jgi:hypothetical protein